MSWSFILYVLISAVVVLGASASYISRQMNITAMILFVGLSAAAVYYAVQWFTSYGYVPNQGGNWPPDGTITVCPDFLTLVKTVSGSTTTYKCKDNVGLGIATDFELQTALAGEARAQALCNAARDAGVTWEGVWNGTSCVGLKRAIPNPAA
jgi:hypothetical protein